MGDVFAHESFEGTAARRESSENSVIVKSPIGAPGANGIRDLVNIPISRAAVEVMMRASCRLGGNSRSRRIKLWGGERSIPKGPAGFVIFRNSKLVVLSCRVTT